MRNFINITILQILLGLSNKENEIGGASSTHGRDEKCIKYFVGNT
jgi:hypothetical protein